MSERTPTRQTPQWKKSGGKQPAATEIGGVQRAGHGRVR
jgi:hypothetical protein